MRRLCMVRSSRCGEDGLSHGLTFSCFEGSPSLPVSTSALVTQAFARMNRSSLGELAGQVIERDLITHCTFSKESVSVAIEKLKLTLPPDDAHTLLRLILRGSGVEEPESAAVEEKPEQPQEAPPASEVDLGRPETAEQPAADTYHKRELFRAAQPAPSPETARTGTTAEEAPVGGDGGAFQEQSVSEEYLDSVLSFALTMRIIEGYTKDSESRTVTLRTGATSTGLSYWETLEYLTNSMLYELRPKTER